MGPSAFCLKMPIRTKNVLYFKKELNHENKVGEQMDYQTQMKLKRWARKPFVTYAFLFIQTLLFILMTFQGGSTNGGTLLRFGAKYGPLIAMGEWWRLILPIFLHIGFMHILMNSVILYFLGIQLEEFYGSFRFMGLYLLSGIAGNAASFAFSNSLSAGASTALFGLFGAAVALGKIYPNNYGVQSMAKSFSTLIIINLVFGLFDSSLDLAVHLGGLIGGYLLSYVFARTVNQYKNGKTKTTYALLFVVFLLVLLGIGYVRNRAFI